MRSGVHPHLALVPDLVPGAGPGLTGPFTPTTAAAAGVGRAALERAVREGELVRLLRGVYLEARRPCPPEVRVAAAGLVVGARQVVVGRTAAWLHGADPAALLDERDGGVVPIEVHARTAGGASRRFRAGEVVRLGTVRCTSAVRTATDLGRRADEEAAQAALDGLLRCGALDHARLVLAANAAADLPGADRLRELAARADGRADGATETVLRMRWLASRLPTPAPGLVVAGRRLSLALPTHRFAAVLDGSLDEDGLVALAVRGWRVLVLDPQRVRSGEARFLVAHLEREFHQHLLRQTGLPERALGSSDGSAPRLAH